MGLGYETARQLQALGVNVIITARDLDTVAQLATEIGVSARQLDVTNHHSVVQLAHAIEDEFGRLDILINNAGSYFDQGSTAMATEMEYVKEAMDTNLMGAWRMIQAFAPLLQKSAGGRIVNVSSGAGSFSDPIFGLEQHPGHVPVYAITKLALNGLTVKLAKEFSDTPLKINAVCPGFVATYPGSAEWGARPVSEGARGIVWAATLPEDAPSGFFFRDGAPLPW